MSKEQLKNLIGSVGYALLKCQLRNVKLKIDAKKKLVTITKDRISHEIGFGEIEQLFNS